MKLIMSFYITQQQAKETLNKIAGIKSNYNIGEISHNEKNDFGLINIWNDVETPPMHQEWVHKFENLDSYYGAISGFSAMTSSGNKFALALTSEDDGEDFVAVLQYHGTRGRFIEECSAWFKPSLEEIVWRNSPDEPVVTDAGLEDDDSVIRNETIIAYESTGPKDMYPWECKSTYIIRKGGNVLRNEVTKTLDELYNTIGDRVLECFAFGIKDDETQYSEFYVGCTNLTANSEDIMRHWFEVIETRETRVAMAKNYVRARLLADSLLNLMV